MMMRLAIVAAFFAAKANAECANACSGAGKCSNYAPSFSLFPEYTWTLPTDVDTSAEVAQCGALGGDSSTTKKDSCICFTTTERGRPTYSHKGADCSSRVCPSGTAFAGTPYKQIITSGATTVVHNQFLECSGKGACSDGVCECYTGYTGKACERQVCPNDCSGRGVCQTQKQHARNIVDISATYYASGIMANVRYESAWDAEKSRGCLCDDGFFGPDCSKQECPSGGDPLGGGGNNVGKACSGRGACNEETGTCECYKGFTGYMCQTQTGLAA